MRSHVQVLRLLTRHIEDFAPALDDGKTLIELDLLQAVSTAEIVLRG
jgi:hypothetical protein